MPVVNAFNASTKKERHREKSPLNAQPFDSNGGWSMKIDKYSYVVAVRKTLT